METKALVWCLRWIIIVILMSSLHVTGKPTLNSENPVDEIADFDPTQVICTPKIIDLCQHCAKKTKSATVYPQCCANHKDVRVWCEQYLHFGLP